MECQKKTWLDDVKQNAKSFGPFQDDVLVWNMAKRLLGEGGNLLTKVAVQVIVCEYSLGKKAV